MKLLTKEIISKFPPLYANEEKDPKDVRIIAKFFAPVGYWTWYATEFDGEDRFFGYVAGDFPELGYFSLSELQGIKLQFGLGIERDLHYGYEHTLEEIMDKHNQVA